MGEFKFSLLTTMPILDSIFLISIQKIAYILENGGWGAGYHVAREYNLSGCVYVGGGGIAQPSISVKTRAKRSSSICGKKVQSIQPDLFYPEHVVIYLGNFTLYKWYVVTL